MGPAFCFLLTALDAELPEKCPFFGGGPCVSGLRFEVFGVYLPQGSNHLRFAG